MAFSYAFRLALMISLFEFLAVYFDILAARWLAFTSLAICTPYVDRDIEKAKMRIKGALAGIFIFTAITLITDDYWILTGIMLILNYIYTLYDPLRYDLKMMFTNISALITAVLVLPEFGTGLEDAATRLICILAGTVIVIICNRIIFPYHIHTENIRLGEDRWCLQKTSSVTFPRSHPGKAMKWAAHVPFCLQTSFPRRSGQMYSNVPMTTWRCSSIIRARLSPDAHSTETR
jgi:hypothetical protein